MALDKDRWRIERLGFFSPNQARESYLTGGKMRLNSVQETGCETIGARYD